MDLLKPDLGLFFWTLVILAVIFMVMRKYAWKPILKALHDREDSIAEALSSAEKAREEIGQLRADNDKLLAEARLERDKILKEAREIKDSLISEAKKTAETEKERIIAEARATVQREKDSAITELKQQVAALSIDMAERILKKKFENKSEQEALVNDYLKNATLN